MDKMSVSAVYLQHRLQLLERQVSTVVQMMKMRQPAAEDDLADLERIWQAEVQEMHAALLRRDSAYFDQRAESRSAPRSI
jgi:hypothetical protein